MPKNLLILATIMLIVGYIIYAIDFYMKGVHNMGTAMLLFAAAMYYLFV